MVFSKTFFKKCKHEQRKKKQTFAKSDVSVSKILSWLLRHAAIRENLNMQSDGYVSFAEILRRRDMQGFCVADVERIVCRER